MIVGGLGFALVFEGLLYALAPRRLKEMAAMIIGLGDDVLRAAGLLAIGTGLLVVYAARVIAAGG
ncbi:MAG TPA: DUF2065 domain-containing protein [Bryobacterales bacterium]|nr:DUF2065 domain-containing protein [Bryobacterales bacterium]